MFFLFSLSTVISMIDQLIPNFCLDLMCDFLSWGDMNQCPFTWFDTNNSPLTSSLVNGELIWGYLKYHEWFRGNAITEKSITASQKVNSSSFLPNFQSAPLSHPPVYNFREGPCKSCEPCALYYLPWYVFSQ